MNRIKKMFSGMINSVKEAIDMFPLTIAIVFALTLVFTFLVIGVDFSTKIEKLIWNIWTIGIFAFFGTWLTEALIADKHDKKRFLGYGISFAIAVILNRLIANEVLEEIILERWRDEYIIVCILITIYLLIKRANLNLEKYVLNLLLNLERVSIIYGIVAIGFFILYSIFLVLIVETANFKIFFRIICMFTGFYYLPVVIRAFGNKEAEDTKFNKVIFSKVLLPLILLAILIIYIYLAKIFLFTELPKNQIFGILSMIFIFAFPVYVINKNYMEKDSMTDKINKAIPYLYTPFIFLQIYSMGIRVKEYGLTVSRYTAFMLVAFEIIAIALAIFKNSKYLKELVLVGLAMSAIMLVSPFNYKDVPLRSQKRIVDRYVAEGKKFDSLTEYDKKKFSGAYKYIANRDDKFINPALSQLEREKLSSYGSYSNSYYDNTEGRECKTVSFHKDINALNISKYKNIYVVGSTYAKEGTMINYSDYDYNISFDIDLKEYAKKIIEADENSHETARRVFKEDLTVITIDEKYDLYITEISFEYYKDDYSTENFRIEGFVLEK